MANAYYSIGTSTTIADIKSALQTQYGSGNVTIYYETSSYLIFFCSTIADKVIKIYVSGTPRFYYGDAYSSGTALTNEVAFAGYSTTATAIHLVLGDSFFYMCWLGSYSGIAVIGKLTNDSYICLGLNSASATASNSKGRDTTNSLDIVPITIGGGFVNSSGKLYKQPVIFVKADGSVEEQTDGNIAGISGLYSISYYTGGGSVLVKNDSYLISPCDLYMSDVKKYLQTGFFAEW